MERLAFVEWNIEQLKHILELYKDNVIMQKSYSQKLEMFEKEREELLNKGK